MSILSLSWNWVKSKFGASSSSSSKKLPSSDVPKKRRVGGGGGGGRGSSGSRGSSGGRGSGLGAGAGAGAGAGLGAGYLAGHHGNPTYHSSGHRSLNGTSYELDMSDGSTIGAVVCSSLLGAMVLSIPIFLLCRYCLRKRRPKQDAEESISVYPLDNTHWGTGNQKTDCGTNSLPSAPLTETKSTILKTEILQAKPKDSTAETSLKAPIVYDPPATPPPTYFR